MIGPIGEGNTSLSQTTTNVRDDGCVLTVDEIRNLAKDVGKPAETLTNLVALIAGRFKTDVCSVYLLEPDRANLVLAATVGLRAQCVGTLRMALHVKLSGSGGGASTSTRVRARKKASAI